MSKYKNTFAKVYTPNSYEKVFMIKKFKSSTYMLLEIVEEC